MSSCTCAGGLKFIVCLVALTLLGVPIGDAQAEDVLPGHDLFTTDSSHTQFDFAVHPIAADFFGPGSDPFDGGVPANSLPLPQNPFCPPTLCVNDHLSATDTMIERLDLATLPAVGDSATIDIEIVALSLQSIDPITVTYGGLNPELWDVHVCLSSEPQQTGQMKLRRTHADGGNFDSELPVTPRFIFTRQSDSEQRVLDGGLAGIMYVLDALWVPWEYDNLVPLSCRSNFCASNPFIATSFSGFATQRLLPICQLEPPIPAMPKTGLMVLIAALAGVGVFVISRFRRGSSSRAY
jgi:hypothetical protein